MHKQTQDCFLCDLCQFLLSHIVIYFVPIFHCISVLCSILQHRLETCQLVCSENQLTCFFMIPQNTRKHWNKKEHGCEIEESFFEDILRYLLWNSSLQYTSAYVMLCAIWCYLYNLKNLENTLGRVLLLLKLPAEICNCTKRNTPPWVYFSTFFKLYKCYQIARSISYWNSYDLLSRDSFMTVQEACLRFNCQSFKVFKHHVSNSLRTWLQFSFLPQSLH